MKHFNQKGSSGRRDTHGHAGGPAVGRGRRTFGGQAGRDARGFGQERRMYRTVCAECGADCEVPFRPDGERPVFCSNCYEEMATEGPPRRDQFKPKRYAGPGGAGSFRRSERPGPGNSIDLKKDLALIQKKLDLILSALKRD